MIIIEKCEICGSKFKDTDTLLNHIRDAHGNDKNEVMIVDQALCTELGVTESQINVIKDTVAKGASDSELLYFLHAAKNMGLSPINKEIYFTKMGGKVTLVTGRDGYLKIAQRNPLFKGLYSGTVYEKDDFKVTTTTGEDGSIIQNVEHSFTSFTGRGKIVGAWARCEMADQSPVVVTASFAEYGKNTPVWKEYEEAMMRKVPEAIVLKRICGISGMVTAAEIADKRSSKELQGMEITDEDKIQMQKNVNDAFFNHSSDEINETNDTNEVIDAAFEIVVEEK